MRLLVGLACAFLFGCGDDSGVHHLPDAPPPPDGAPDAALEGPVTLTVMKGTTPRASVRVLFQNADSTVVSDTMTGANGKATATMKAGGYVTVFDPFPNPGALAGLEEMRTWAGVKPGDELEVYQPDGSTASVIDVTFKLPIDATASEYHVSTNCAREYPIIAPATGGQPTATFQLQGCGATSNVLVETLDQAQALDKSFFKPSVTLTNGGMVDLSADTYAAIPDYVFNYTNVPASINQLGIQGTRNTALGEIKHYSGNNIVSGSSTLPIKIPLTGNATAINVTRFYGPMYTEHDVLEWGPAGTAYTLDAASLFLGDFGGVAVLDAANHKITWTTSGGVQADFVKVTARLQRDLMTSTASWQWSISGPAGSEIAFPVLPDASPYNPMAGDFGDYDVTLAKVPGGYDAVRNKIWSTDGYGTFMTAASGKAVFALLAPPQL